MFKFVPNFWEMIVFFDCGIIVFYDWYAEQVDTNTKEQNNN